MFQLNKLFFLQSTKIYLLYKKSFSRMRVDEVFGLQFFVSALCGDHADFQIFCQTSDGRKHITWRKLPV